MRIPGITMLLALCLSPHLLAQDGASAQGPQGTLDEVVVTGDRSLLSLRTRMLEAERNAYEIFNQFNDETRFDIQCTMHQVTGGRIQRQICQPRFELDAATPHAMDFLNSYRSYLDPYNLGYAPHITHQPVAATIAAQQRSYQRKMQQVAEEHPQFLEALMKYAEAQEQYEQATSMAKK